MLRTKTRGELETTEWYGAGEISACKVSFQIQKNEWSNFEESKLFRELKQYVEGERSIVDIERNPGKELSDMTDAEIFRQQLELLAKKSARCQDACGLSILTEAMIQLLQVKGSTQNYQSLVSFKDNTAK